MTRGTSVPLSFCVILPAGFVLSSAAAASADHDGNHDSAEALAGTERADESARGRLSARSLRFRVFGRPRRNTCNRKTQVLPVGSV